MIPRRAIAGRAAKEQGNRVLTMKARSGRKKAKKGIKNGGVTSSGPAGSRLSITEMKLHGQTSSCLYCAIRAYSLPRERPVHSQSITLKRPRHYRQRHSLNKTCHPCSPSTRTPTITGITLVLRWLGGGPEPTVQPAMNQCCLDWLFQFQCVIPIFIVGGLLTVAHHFSESCCPQTVLVLLLVSRFYLGVWVLARWLTGLVWWLSGWPAGLVISCLAGWLVVRLVGCLFVCLVG